MYNPIIINEQGFQEVWVKAIELLDKYGWEHWNLVVHIQNPLLIDETFHSNMVQFTTANNIFKPKDVAYTIFPYNLYNGRGTANKLYSSYERFYRWTRTREHSGWGTYFRRMTHYEVNGEVINQLDNIITAINTRSTVSKAAYTIVIEQPGGETIRLMGAPCLNYLAVQVSPGNPPTLGMLGIYRNHDFLHRAYGNYWGLCKLLYFLVIETNMAPGPLTCISSHAYVSEKKTQLKSFIRGVNGK